MNHDSCTGRMLSEKARQYRTLEDLPGVMKVEREVDGRMTEMIVQKAPTPLYELMKGAVMMGGCVLRCCRGIGLRKERWDCGFLWFCLPQLLSSHRTADTAMSFCRDVW